ncbi:4Fe-4S ferredoxin iron-sulfur binding domain-containing protein [Clostridium sp. DL-VIII]|uniref:4Fe-4S binding protein n=1 Tax=Clostridium sp. DL-VIII TaxID=641107 RepID=UPI00023AF34B|nr:4Fe-4S binding protein [Clostridium sp. DL-VIII]EHI97717.1 4Fe-4S ferredoxin iron-sulfur binding domain-containing protein [Clostridium sp. DL-VIII]
MVNINENCKGCGICEKNCPLNSIKVENKKAQVEAKCVECGICIRVCPFKAIEKSSVSEKSVVCSSCPIQCHVKEGFTGACKRYTNENGTLVRNRALVINNDKVSEINPKLATPIITGVGAGTTYPCLRPAPHIVSENRNGIDVVTVVTEAPLSYSGVTVKLDTNSHIGEAGDKIYRDGKIVGMVSTEEYGSKMLSIGGANLLTSKEGFIVAKTIVELANGEEVNLSVNKKISLKLKTGLPPIIDGIEETKMRVGCGSATVGLFARKMKEVCDEVIVIDHHVIGLLSEHLAGAEVGLSWSGVILNGNKSSRGRYFGDMGDGIGGTTIKNPKDIIKGFDMNIAKIGMKILVTDTTGKTRAFFELLENGEIKEIQLTKEADELVTLIYNNCEDSKVSVMYVGGTGGSARGGVAVNPIAVTKAVHEGKAVLTIGGAPTFVMPGGGINFIVDTEKVVNKAFTWVPTPATVAPVEYTMTKADYEAIGGHMEKIVDINSFEKED